MINFKTLALTAIFAASALAQYSTPMRDVEHQVRNAVVVAYTCTNNGSTQAGCSTNYQIPAVHRLAVTQVTVFTIGSLGQGYPSGYVYVVGTLGGSQVMNFFKINNYVVTQNNVTTECFFVIDSLVGATVYGPSGGGTLQLTGYLYKM